MALTPFQLKYLRYDLIGLADIKYDDVVDELLDHYASLTEQKMTNGLAFEEASKQAWTDLGAEKGVQKIQASFVNAIKQQIKTKHITILKSYFRWPTLLTTVLVGLLAYVVVPLFPVKELILYTFFIGLIPYLFILRGFYYGFHKQTNTGKLVWEYMFHKGGLAVNLIQIGLNLPKGFLENAPESTRTFLQTYPPFRFLFACSCYFTPRVSSNCSSVSTNTNSFNPPCSPPPNLTFSVRIYPAWRTLNTMK